MAAFALTPALAVNGIIDMASSEGIKLYEKGTKHLDKDEPIACTQQDLYRALRLIDLRAEEYGWNREHDGILWIPKQDANGNVTMELITTSYGVVSYDDVRDFEETYIGSETREAQDNNMLYHAIMRSLSKEAKNKILLKKKEYTTDEGPSANLLIKILVRECHLDTNATVSTIRQNLTELDHYMVTVGYDISKFNDHVRVLIEGLETRGETSSDIMVNLFKGYANAKDKLFKEYIRTKKDAYDEAEGVPPFDENKLMVLAENKYKNMKTNETWNAPSEHEQQLVALQAQIKSLKEKRKRAPTKAQQDDEGKKEQGSEGSGKQHRKPDWLYKHQEPNDVKETRVWGKNEYKWCCDETGGKCGGKWRVHDPATCKGKDFMKTGTNGKKRLKLESALSAMIVNEDGDDDEMEYED